MDENLKVLTQIKDLLLQQNIYNKDILSFKEAISYLDVSESFLYKLTSESRITYSKPGGKLIYFKKVDLDKWLLQNRNVGIGEMKTNLNNYFKKSNNE